MKKNTNIEILRLLSIFFIVAGHFIGQSGYSSYSFTISDFGLCFLGSGLRIAVNLFVVIGCWYMVDTQFDGARVWCLWGNVFVYSAPLTSLVILFTQEWGKLDAIRGFLPFLGRGLWYASAYITLVLLSPFLNKILSWQKKQIKFFLVLLILFVSFICTMPDAQESYVLDSIWFWVLYLMVGYIKRYGWMWDSLPNAVWAIGAILMYCVMTICRFVILIGESNPILSILGNLSVQYLFDIKSLPNWICALSLFRFFISLKEKNIQWINIIAKPVFSVYIFHQVPVFYPYLWNDIFDAGSFIKDGKIVYVLWVFLAVYFSVSVIDVLRRKVLEPAWKRSRAFIKLTNTINRIYENCQ